MPIRNQKELDSNHGIRITKSDRLPSSFRTRLYPVGGSENGKQTLRTQHQTNQHSSIEKILVKQMKKKL
jgi:hypothetical protein